MLDRDYTLELDRLMSDDSPPARNRRERAEREARLARALRENLRRRKDKARAQQPPPEPAKTAETEPSA